MRELEVRVGDRFLLATDGLWDAIPDADVRRVFADLDPQSAAEELVRLANANGGPDNSTAVIISVVRESGDLGQLREVRLPREEAPETPVRLRSAVRLRAPRWPWVVLLVSAALGGLALAKKLGVLDVVEVVLHRLG